MADIEASDASLKQTINLFLLHKRTQTNMGGRYFIAVVILVHLMSKHQIINDKRMDIRYIFSSLLLPFYETYEETL